MTKTILVTGGLGYIGSQLSYNLLISNYKVIIVDSLKNSDYETFSSLIKNFKNIKFYKFDLNSTSMLEKIFSENKIDLVIHLASLKSIQDSLKKSHYFINNNVKISLNLFRKMLKYNVDKLIFASSAAIYENHSSLISEDHKQKLNDPYSISKSIIENYIESLAFEKKLNFKIYIFRYFNPVGYVNDNIFYGNPLTRNQKNLFEVLLDYHVKKKVFCVFGNNFNTYDGTCVRDFIDIQDLIDVHLKAVKKLLNSDTKEIQKFNLGSGKGTTILQVIREFEKIFKIKIKYEFTLPRKNEIVSSIANTSKLEKYFHWKSKYSLEKSVNSIKNYYDKKIK